MQETDFNKQGSPLKGIEEIESPKNNQTTREIFSIFSKNKETVISTGIILEHADLATPRIKSLIKGEYPNFKTRQFIPYKERYGITEEFSDLIEERIRNLNEMERKITEYKGNILGRILLIEEFYKTIYGEEFKTTGYTKKDAIEFIKPIFIKSIKQK